MACIGKMLIYNTLTSSKEEFKPIHGKRVKMFVCGITPYDSPHIGNLRTFIFFDAITKYMRLSGYDVFYLQNITDIDDKIINRAQEKDAPAMELSDGYLREYMDVMKLFSVDSVSFYARATYHIDEIIEQIRILEEKKYAYRLDDGIYFRVSAFGDYGKLSGQRSEQLKSGTRVNVAENKENQGDFVLWKFRKPGEPYWPSPWGDGRPGWNIEDTAITQEYFGDVYDIHGGGTDLMFPHHEGEIAIMRSISGQPVLSNYWMHSGMLTLNGQKMSKSLNNFLTPEDILKNYSASEIRFSMLSSHYRSLADFSIALLEESRKNLNYMRKAIRILSRSEGKGSGLQYKQYMDDMKSSMDDDFNTRETITALMELSGKVIESEDSISRAESSGILEVFRWADSFLSVIFSGDSSRLSPKTVDALLKLRESLRAQKMFRESDSIRNALRESGIAVEDNKQGGEWFYE